MRFQWISIVIPLSLAACQTPAAREPVVRDVEVRIPVPTPCDTSGVPASPDYPDTNERLSGIDNIFAGVAILKAGRELRIKRIAELEAALGACSAPIE